MSRLTCGCGGGAYVHESRVKPGQPEVGDIPMCVIAPMDLFTESPLMLSCTSCVTEEVCHCFPSGGNLANVRWRSKMAAMVNYTGRGCILQIMAGDSLCSGRRIFKTVALSLICTLLPECCTYIFSSHRMYT